MQYGQLTLPNTSQVFLLMSNLFLLMSNFIIGKEEEARTLALEVIPVVSGDLQKTNATWLLKCNSQERINMRTT